MSTCVSTCAIVIGLHRELNFLDPSYGRGTGGICNKNLKNFTYVLFCSSCTTNL